VVPAEILSVAGDLLEQYGLISNRPDGTWYVQRAQALDYVLQALMKSHGDAVPDHTK
jgi:hypothetical protein